MHVSDVDDQQFENVPPRLGRQSIERCPAATAVAAAEVHARDVLTGPELACKLSPNACIGPGDENRADLFVTHSAFSSLLASRTVTGPRDYALPPHTGLDRR